MSVSPFALRRTSLTSALLVAGAALLPAGAHADAVTEWNALATPRIATAGAPPMQLRLFAIMNIAIHDALNAINPRFETYSAQDPAAAGASPDAAVIAAAYGTLKVLLPTHEPALRTLYDHRLAELPPCPTASPNCIADGVAAGAAAAADIIALRANDGSATPHRPYTLPPGPGVYQPTPPQLAAPTLAGWVNVTPFAVNSTSQFRPEPDEMMDIRSKKYARELREVQADGSSVVRAAAPDSEPSRIARYWPPVGWNAVADVIVSGRGLDSWQHARLFALMNMAQNDALFTTFGTKYHYNFWRPVTAIRAADTDGNADTAADPTWLSYVATPPYPDYPCGLTTVAGASTEVLRQHFGNGVHFTFTAAGLTRSFRNLPQADAEAVDARVFGGMHFRTGCEVGIKVGSEVAKFVVEHQLRPR